MQTLNLPGCVSNRAVVVDDVIRDAQTFLPTGLSRYHAPCLLFGFGISIQEALQLGLFAAVDHEYPVHELPHGRFGQQRNDDDLVGAAGLPGLPDRRVADARMQDRLQYRPLRVVGEHQLAKAAPIKPACGVQHFVAEPSRNFLQCRAAWPDHLPRNDVGIDDGDASGGEHIRNQRFAAGDATSEADSE